MFKFLTSLFATQSVRRFGPPSPVLGRPSPPSPGLLGTPSPPSPGLLGTPSPPSPGLLGTPMPSLFSGTFISCSSINTVCNTAGFRNCLLLDDNFALALDTSCGVHGDMIEINGTLIEFGASGCYEIVNITECQTDPGLPAFLDDEQRLRAAALHLEEHTYALSVGDAGAAEDELELARLTLIEPPSPSETRGLTSCGIAGQCDYYEYCLFDMINGNKFGMVNMCEEALKSSLFYFNGEIRGENTIYLNGCWPIDQDYY